MNKVRNAGRYAYVLTWNLTCVCVCIVGIYIAVAPVGCHGITVEIYLLQLESNLRNPQKKNAPQKIIHKNSQKLCSTKNWPYCLSTMK